MVEMGFRAIFRFAKRPNGSMALRAAQTFMLVEAQGLVESLCDPLTPNLRFANG
jgi:hypothetical protein